jgi:hypothetical protein
MKKTNEENAAHPTVLADGDSLGGDRLVLDIHGGVDSVVEREEVTPRAQSCGGANHNAAIPPVDMASGVHRHTRFELHL